MFLFSIQALLRHESVLSAHMEMLRLVRNGVSSDGDGDALRVVASMVDRTEELMKQLKTIKSQLVCSSPSLLPLFPFPSLLYARFIQIVNIFATTESW